MAPAGQRPRIFALTRAVAASGSETTCDNPLHRPRAHALGRPRFSALVHAVSLLALSRPAEPRVLEVAATLDLTLFVPALYWLFRVRGRGWPTFSLLPVFLASLLLASLVLPAGREGTLHLLEYLGAPAKLALIALLVLRVRRGQPVRCRGRR